MARARTGRVTRERRDKYVELNGKYLREARELFDRAQLEQSSEKLWGACAEIVKAVAAGRGIELGTHSSLWEFVARLGREVRDPGLLEDFSYAGNLHANFYEGWLTEDYVRRGLEIVERFAAKLRKLL